MVSQSFAAYNVGDTISVEHQNMEFSYCYPSDSTASFSFSKNKNKIILLEMSASWWSPCYNSIPEGDEIFKHWENDPRVEVVHFLDDLYQPYSCSQWGETGDAGIPPIVDDGAGYNVFEWFANPSGPGIFPLIAVIDHQMIITSILGTSLSPIVANIMIQTLLDKIPADDLSITTINNSNGLKNFRIRQLYPNPFNPSLTIDLYSFESAAIDVDILSIEGKLITTLHSGLLMPGDHQLTWNASSQPAGVYLISVLSEGGGRLVRKVVLLK